MSRDPQRLNDYLAHILEAIERIARYTVDMDESTFMNDQLVQDAVIRNFEIIGEASNNIEKNYPEFTAAHPELPLSSAYEMRNAVAHGYFKVDFAILWRTLRSDLPGLHERVQEVRGDSEGRKL
ncbi:HepT-like ribonuclease domain-containing protein [Variovorax ureilyticus]|uniref:HepT-like ribonuclease domain-containing protein n=1 Tax=Variovorax ureilyticus TaxID=1836198 RepID=UPI003D669BF5